MKNLKDQMSMKRAAGNDAQCVAAYSLPGERKPAARIKSGQQSWSRKVFQKIPLPFWRNSLWRDADPSPARSFALPRHIVATHYTGNTFAPDMWGSLKLSEVPFHFKAIRSNGFNTVIFPVPWTGFQMGIDPPDWNGNYFSLLENLFDAAASEDMGVILRVGYLHELNDPGSPDGLRRALDVFFDPTTQRAWLEYLRRLYEITQRHSNTLFSFLSWEDFFLYWTMDLPAEIRLALARDMGFQDFLRDTSLKKISRLYGRRFSSQEEVPIPLYDTRAAVLFYAFQDHLWLRLLSISRSVFPEIQFEVRTDCDPTGGGRLFSHEKTFDLGGQGGITVLYYTPAWGAPNRSDQASAWRASGRLKRMLRRIRKKTNNPLFINQFNFIDNTLGFSRNTRIYPSKIPDFFLRSAPILKRFTIGYGLWTMQDKPRSILKNGSFELGERYWSIQGGRIIEATGGGRSLVLDAGGEAVHPLILIDGAIGADDTEAIRHSLIFRLSAANPSKESTHFFVSFYREDEKQVFKSICQLAAEEEKTFEFADIPWFPMGRLVITCLRAFVRFDQAFLYAFVQKNGIYDLDGNPRHFRDALLQLNAALLDLVESPPGPFSENTGQLHKHICFGLHEQTTVSDPVRDCLKQFSDVG